MPVYNDKDGKKVRLKRDGTPDRRRPPKEYQFKPKQSGNAKGRPKKRKSPSELLESAAQEQVKVEGKLITFDELASKQLVRKAGSGDLRAIALMSQLRSRGAPGSTAETAEEKATREQAYRDFVEMLHHAFEPLRPFEASGLCVWGERFEATVPKWVVDECWRRYDPKTGQFDHGERVSAMNLPEHGRSRF